MFEAIFEFFGELAIGLFRVEERGWAAAVLALVVVAVVVVAIVLFIRA